MLVQEEVWRTVLEAVRSEAPLSLAKQVRKIARGLPAAGFSPQNIADALIYAAVDRGVAVEMTKPAPRQTIDLPSLFAFVGKKRKSEGNAKAPPTFVGNEVPAAP